ncbi:MAG TPA: aldo/keto reductase [Phycisphaerales bacterium]|nr:aldo/keto reductase [Phycisphaerales bacterium]
MQSRPLGSTGIMVSPLGLGTVALGRAEGLKYPKPVRIPSDEEASALLRRARELGVNLIDTAPAYGLSEERLGSLLRGERGDWVVVTKAGEEFYQRYDFSPDSIVRSVERSLTRLRTDYLDAVLLHSDGVVEAGAGADEAYDALARLRERGLVRAIGASTKTEAGADRATERCDVVMLTCNEQETAMTGAIERAHSRGLGVLVKKPLGSGHARDAARAIRFVFDHPGVTAAIVGTTNPDHLADNVRAVEGAMGGGTS